MAVVLNFRTADRTIRAVESLERSEAPVGRIIVVDNASGDDSADRLCALRRVHVLVAEANGGFSAGCNLGIREALRLGASRVFLVNSDAVVPAETLGALERALDSDASLGIVAPVLVSQTDPDVVESAGMSYSAATGRVRHLGFRARRSAMPGFERRDVAGVSACAMLVRRSVFDRVGLLAEEYFFGFEDLDFCLRARAAGFGAACIGTTPVLHEGGASIGQTSARRIYFATRNHLLLARRHGRGSSVLARCLRPATIMGLNLAHVLLTARVPVADGLGAFARGARDHFAGNYGAGSTRADH
jgi:GT2 family glycosyltransferase